MRFEKKVEQFLRTKPSYLKESIETIYSRLLYEGISDVNLRSFESKEIILEVRSRLNKELNFRKSIKKEEDFKWVIKGDQRRLNPYLNGDPNNVLVLGDTHEPFCKEGYLEFCREQQEKYNCGTVVHIGDLVDNHAMSYHQHDPDGKSPGDEFKMALEKCKEWYRVFPDVKICIGNHDALPFRKVFTAGLPSNWLKSYQEILESPSTWKWDFVHQLNGVIYQHGTGLSGEMAAINCARENRQSTVIGHLHTVCNTRFLASYKDLIFGVSVGCGIDHHSYAFAYGKENTRKPVMACAVVLNGELPINVPMFSKI